jgi:hypothetical protein
MAEGPAQTGPPPEPRAQRAAAAAAASAAPVVEELPEPEIEEPAKSPEFWELKGED